MTFHVSIDGKPVELTKEQMTTHLSSVSPDWAIGLILERLTYDVCEHIESKDFCYYQDHENLTDKLSPYKVFDSEKVVSK